ncbi:uncharacterized protein G2W53_034649 [Senna tora]|uniref:Uncharacterized protein n=1 Tax=Senna tora TaxID=362788 RepID=A0A834T1W7_9FABA|nr:uncharacterized protein G2W53_034649 [Senna tora]
MNKKWRNIDKIRQLKISKVTLIAYAQVRLAKHAIIQQEIDRALIV